MAEKTEEKTPFKAKTKDQVAAMAKEGKSAAEIAEALGKTQATVYSHLRNLGVGPKRGRGRPRKSDAEKAETTDAKSETKATRARPGAKAPADSNGHAPTTGDLRKTVEALIKAKQTELSKLEKVLATLDS